MNNFLTAKHISREKILKLTILFAAIFLLKNMIFLLRKKQLLETEILTIKRNFKKPLSPVVPARTFPIFRMLPDAYCSSINNRRFYFDNTNRFKNYYSDESNEGTYFLRLDHLVIYNETDKSYYKYTITKWNNLGSIESFSEPGKTYSLNQCNRKNL